MASYFSQFKLWPAPANEGGGIMSTAVVIASTVVATAALLPLLRRALWPTHPRVIPSPLSTVIPRLSEEETKRLQYRSDAFPGARDVLTPYGSIRVYEWGPEDGPKVLFVHGISTTCMTLGPLAHAMVKEKGCRVMMFDLFGRGFTDGVGDLPHDARLYCSQILLALASSPLPWTGNSAFSLVGYSLGGGVCVHFGGSFPHMVSSLILLAPAGLIRAETFGVITNFVFTTNLFPSRFLAAITKRRLRKPIAANNRGNRNKLPSPAPPIVNTKTKDAIAASLAEAIDPAGNEPVTPLERRVLGYVQWMVTNHLGFVPAFISCIRDAPLVGQQAAWRRLGTSRKAGSTAIILGQSDEIIDPEDYEADALPLVGGEEHVHWVAIPGGHDFPMTHARETLEEIYKAWECMEAREKGGVLTV
ncbi:Alpha/Beta hydrolase protein [Podospora didyma]|uniref:Alpha/Beta hydrolase protein n=1 Tax=Podospora didyma TaxID=330526 RepID=A0AAE0P6Z0_9PEZI|nr:Alpha/Beta hydrolase protein [Podospora didyma]